MMRLFHCEVISLLAYSVIGFFIIKPFYYESFF